MQSANVTHVVLYLTNVQGVISNLNGNHSDFYVPCTKSCLHLLSTIFWAVPNLPCISLVPYVWWMSFFFFLFFCSCNVFSLLTWYKESSWRSKHRSNSTQGAHSHPVIDVRYLWDDGLKGKTYEKGSGVGLKRTLLKLQQYWARSPLSPLERNRENINTQRTWIYWVLQDDT